MARYPRALKPNYALDRVNCFALNLGTPKLADTDWIVVDAAMKATAYTLAHANSGDSPNYGRNITVKTTQAGGTDDTGLDVVITGTDVNGVIITETITAVIGTTVAGALAFATVTSVLQADWVIGGTTADRIEVGFGALVGIPPLTGAGNQAFWVAAIDGGTALVVTSSLGGTYQAATIAHDGTVSGTTFDLSAGTYNGSKRAFVVYAL